MTDSRKPNLIRAANTVGSPRETSAEEGSFSHPLNPNSEVHMRTLSDGVGLQRIGFHLMRIPPGKESFAYHSHYTEEELIYILSGRGIAEIDQEEVEVGPGDFMGFPTPSVAHHLRNPFEEDLVYLSGGERNPSEIADFPRLGKRMARSGTNIAIHHIDEAEALGPFPLLGAK